MIVTSRNVSTAYALWCLCLLGLCGGQRFYCGRIGSGLLYLLTFGVFGIGQFIDLFLIPEMVGGSGSGIAMAHANASNTINLNIGDLKDVISSQPQTTGEIQSPLQKLMFAAKENQGQLSFAQVLMATGLDTEEAKSLLADAERNQICETTNHTASGAIRYKFDI